MKRHLDGREKLDVEINERILSQCFLFESSNEPKWPCRLGHCPSQKRYSARRTFVLSEEKEREREESGLGKWFAIFW